MEVATDRATRLFKFLRELHNIGNPLPTALDQYSWRYRLDTLPEHPDVHFVGYSGEGLDYILRVARPKLSPPPTPPRLLEGWIEGALNDPNHQPVRAESRELDGEGEPRIILFAEDPRREKAWQDWLQEWRTWASAERPNLAAQKVFEDFYALKGQLDREGDRLELVLGDGILSWSHLGKSVYHPLLLQRVQLEFELDKDKPEFRIVEADSPPELYGAALRECGVDAGAEPDIRKKLEDGSYHPLAPETSEFYIYAANRLHLTGEFIENSLPPKDSNNLLIGRVPVLFLRPRSQGFSRVIEGVLKVLPERIGDLTPLQRVVGVEAGANITGQISLDATEPELRSWDYEDVLVSKPINREQLLVFKNVRKHTGVVVQGPPGTGKTHTIANLIGQLLAEGKSVLVTAHTSKALRVLRDKVAPELQPLCVSVLDSDQESRRQLEASVAFITEKIGQGAEKLDEESRTLEKARERLLRELAEKRQKLIEALGGEYREVVAAGSGYAPSEAARLVREYEDKGHNWIPGKVHTNGLMPLSTDELEELYQSNADISPQDEADLRAGLPSMEKLPEPSKVEKWQQLLQQQVEPGSERPELWKLEPSLEQLEALQKRLNQVLHPVMQVEQWHMSVIAAGFEPQLKQIWVDFIKLIESTRKLALEAQNMLIQFEPTLSDGIPVTEQAQQAGEIANFLKRGGKLNLLTLLKKSKWKAFIEKAQVASVKPSTYEHFRALEFEASLRVERQRLLKRWEALIGAVSEVKLGSSNPEMQAAQYIPILKSKLEWYSQFFLPFRMQLLEAGFDMDAFQHSLPPNPQPNGELLNLVAALDELASILESKRVRVAQQLGNSEIANAISYLGLHKNTNSADLVEALKKGSPTAYEQAYRRLFHLHQLIPRWERRMQLLGRLRETAPGWARAIEKREGIHGDSRVPNEPQKAWLHRVLSQELDERTKTSINASQREVAKLERDLYQVTAELIDRKAWSAQIKKTTYQQRLALTGWMSTIKKIGKGKGKRAPALKREAAKLLAQCRSAVPVWIMPLGRVVEQFRPEDDPFDVVIIDEASQADLSALFLFAMARKIVVVGDDKQVSPVAIGEEIEKVSPLQQAHLDGIPNNHLFDGKYSIYEVARSGFGGQVMLREHFRSVPEIIQFSNMLCYDGRIRPLRESGHSKLKPAVRAVRVKGFAEPRNTKINLAETEEIVRLVKSCVGNPLYAGKTFGVISMVGEEQALKIEQMLRDALSPAELEGRRLICGNPAQFQGDERDVVFISMVDVPQGGPLSMRETELWQQRFNVAASRAKDQMWVVYSLDPAVDLKPGDLRRRLIEHALQPENSIHQMKIEGAKAESPFEHEVLEHLTRAGFKVIAQYPVGSYRIDLVVESSNKKVAIECDGDRFHPSEKWPEDLERQRILERIGWRFIRIRGSSFYRDRDGTMIEVIKELEKLGIRPSGNETSPQVQVQEEDLEPLRNSSTSGIPTSSSASFEISVSELGNPDPMGAREDASENLGAIIQIPGTVKQEDQNNQITPEDQAKIDWVLSTHPDMWFELAHWAKMREHFAGWERKLIFDIGKYVKFGRVSYKQARQALRLYEEARKLGFSPSREN